MHFPLARSGQLQLDKAVVIREVGFYGLSIALLYFALQDRHPADDDEVGDDHIFINFFDACAVFGGYILYVIVCAKMDDIVALLSCGTYTQTPDGGNTINSKSYGAVEVRKRLLSGFWH